MSVSIKYKGAEIASASTEVTKTIKTAGKYCEADILVENTPDGGDAPVINPLSVTANGTYTAPSGVDGYSPVTVNVPQGITPTGSVTLTSENTYDVTDKATAIVDFSATRADLAEAVTAKGVDTLPTSSFDTIVTNIGLIEGGGGGGTEITIETPLTSALDVYNFLVSHTPAGATLATATLTNKDPSAFLAYQFLAWAYLTTSRVGGYVRINNGAITANTVISSEYSTRLGVGDKIIINVIY